MAKTIAKAEKKGRVGGRVGRVEEQGKKSPVPATVPLVSLSSIFFFVFSLSFFRLARDNVESFQAIIFGRQIEADV